MEKHIPQLNFVRLLYQIFVVILDKGNTILYPTVCIHLCYFSLQLSIMQPQDHSLQGIQFMLMMILTIAPTGTGGTAEGDMVDLFVGQ